MADRKFGKENEEEMGPKSGVSNEVSDLIKSRATDYEAWRKLKEKYGDKNTKLVDDIMDAYKKKMEYIYRKVKKFKTILLNKYHTLALNNVELLRKAKKYQRKYKLSDDEFDMFIILLKTDTSHKYNFGAQIPTTTMAKTLGYEDFLMKSTGMNVKPDEQSMIEEIVNLYGQTKPMHSQVILQSIVYEDCGPEALVGVFDPNKHNPYSYVHPIIAALFIPKIELFEQQMLMSNIGYIVHCKSKAHRIQTLPDFNLYWAMISDPNDLVCNDINAVKDIKNRYLLQTQIWDAVLNIRSGKYYHSDSAGYTKFMTAVENCKNVIHDAPDFTYVKDEGTLFRRMLSAFSLYPTYISVNRLWGLNVGSSFPSTPLEMAGFSNIKRVPMITLRLPLKINGSAAISLEDALEQPQWFVEHKTIVPKSLQIIHSNGVMMFYVARRYHSVNIARLAMPYNFTNLPMTVSGIESINKYPVNAPCILNIVNDTFELKSVVAIETIKAGEKEIVSGCSAMIKKSRDPLRGNYDEICYYYNPQDAGSVIVDPNCAEDKYTRNKPISILPIESAFNMHPHIPSFEARARSNGTIFIYKKVTENPSPYYDASAMGPPIL